MGRGVQIEDGNGNETDEGKDKSQNQKLPCPIMEFRLANRLNGTVGGEILDASVNIVASIDASQATRPESQMRRRRGKKGKRKMPRRQPTVIRQRGSSVQKIADDLLNTNDEEESKDTETEDDKSPFRSEFTIRRSNRHLNTKMAMPLQIIGPARQPFDEDPTGHLVPKRVFSKLEVESPDHPFFKRAWIVRHRLDQNSPLLTTEARQLMKNCNGGWPPQLNSAEGVRSAVKFDQVIVSMSGTSNADANSVYAQKVYEYVDISVGYCFVNLLYRDPVDEGLRADIRLINDVVEQAGGGGEDFRAIQRQSSNRMSNVLVL